MKLQIMLLISYMKEIKIFYFYQNSNESRSFRKFYKSKKRFCIHGDYYYDDKTNSWLTNEELKVLIEK